MQIEDRLYGQMEVTESVLIDLISSDGLGRLKDISQSGLPQVFTPLKSYSRFEHSLGVMLLLRKIGASLEEQIVGLVHDISHLAFSHVAEWIYQGNKGEKAGLNNLMTQKFIWDSDVGKILIKHGYNPDKIANLYDYPVVKRKFPNIYADCIDYGLRDSFYWFDSKLSTSVVDNLVIHETGLVFKDKAVALSMAETFFKLQLDYWGGKDNILRYEVFSQLLKMMIDKKIISDDDLFATEKMILEKILQLNDPQILKNKNILLVMDYTGKFPILNQKISKRLLCFIPEVLIDNKLISLGELYPEFQQKFNHYQAVYEEGILV